MVYKVNKLDLELWAKICCCIVKTVQNDDALIYNNSRSCFSTANRDGTDCTMSLTLGSVVSSTLMLCCDSSPATSMPVFEAELLASLTEICITQEWFSASHVSNQHRHLQLLASASASTALPATVCCLESEEAAAESLDHQALIPYNPLLVLLMTLSNNGQEPCTPAQEPAHQDPAVKTASTSSAVRGAFLAGKLLGLVGLHTHSDQEAGHTISFSASSLHQKVAQSTSAAKLCCQLRPMRPVCC